MPNVLELGERRLVAEVRGWRGVATHRRRIEWVGDAIEITDELAPPVVTGMLRWFVAGGLAVRAIDHGALVFLPRGETVELVVRGAAVVVEPAQGWRAIGAPAPRTCIRTELGLRPRTTIIRVLR